MGRRINRFRVSWHLFFQSKTTKTVLGQIMMHELSKNSKPDIEVLKALKKRFNSHGEGRTWQQFLIDHAKTISEINLPRDILLKRVAKRKRPKKGKKNPTDTRQDRPTINISEGRNRYPLKPRDKKS